MVWCQKIVWGGCQSGEYVVNNSICLRLKADVQNNPTVLEAQDEEKSLVEPCGLAERKHKYYYRVLNFHWGIKGWTATVSERARQLCYTGCIDGCQQWKSEGRVIYWVRFQGWMQQHDFRFYTQNFDLCLYYWHDFIMRFSLWHLKVKDSSGQKPIFSLPCHVVRAVEIRIV